ncbi:MAG: sugar phosphate isomerase/epimerase [Lachnospiraceae bacterium]|nr:sugar phosphate isomerase/epimerase [Lachnospiraceae bacterium]
MIIPGIVSVTFRDKTVEDIIRLCKEADLKAVEWSENAHVMPADEAGAKALYEKTRAAGLQIAAYGSYYRLGQQENPKEVFEASLISAKSLHAPLIRIWAGTEPSAKVGKEQRKALAEEAFLICEMAKKAGIKVAMEWHRNTLTDTNASAMDFLKEVSHENLYCLWQPTVALSMKERMDGLDLLGDRVLNLHIYYWPDGVRRPLKEGTGAWQQYLEHVDKENDRFGLLEFVMGDTEEQFLKDARTLHDILGQ